MRVDLPWPPVALWPNRRVHWNAKAREASNYRHAAFYSVNPKDAKAFRATETIPVSVTFCPPDKRRRDLDNMLAAIKAGLDGIALALDVDDAAFAPTLHRGPVTKRGAVIVEIETGGAD